MSALNETGDPPPSRDELITLIVRAHAATAAYGESALAGKALAAQSKLPKVIAENLGAGFGQWEFFPTPAEIVDFALAYAPPATEEDLWALARAWASDDAAARPTLMTLVGRDILQHELRRIDVPALRELVETTRPVRARELRTALGLDVAPVSAPKAAKRTKPTASPSASASVSASASDPASASASAPASASPSDPASASAAPRAREIPIRMPKPEFKAPPKPAPKPIAKRFQHPKFGEGVLQAQDGVGPDAKLTIKFDAGPKTLLAKYVTELPT